MEEEIDAAAGEVIRGVVEGIHCRIYSHNKSVSKGNGGDYVDAAEELASALYRLKEALINLALEGTDIR